MWQSRPGPGPYPGDSGPPKLLGVAQRYQVDLFLWYLERRFELSPIMVRRSYDHVCESVKPCVAGMITGPGVVRQDIVGHVDNSTPQSAQVSQYESIQCWVYHPLHVQDVGGISSERQGEE